MSHTLLSHVPPTPHDLFGLMLLAEQSQVHAHAASPSPPTCGGLPSRGQKIQVRWPTADGVGAWRSALVRAVHDDTGEVVCHYERLGSFASRLGPGSDYEWRYDVESTTPTVPSRPSSTTRARRDAVASARPAIGKRARRAPDFFKPQTTVRALRVGDVVQACYLRSKDRRYRTWYSGVVTCVRADGGADVAYDDGDFEAAVLRENVRIVRSVPSDCKLLPPSNADAPSADERRCATPTAVSDTSDASDDGGAAGRVLVRGIAVSTDIKRPSLMTPMESMCLEKCVDERGEYVDERTARRYCLHTVPDARGGHYVAALLVA